METNTEASHTYAISTPAYPAQDNYFAVTARGYNYDEDSSGSVGNRILVKVSQVYTGTPTDQDGDTLSDFDELRLMYNPADGDMDGDGLSDGQEDINANGRVDEGESDPKDASEDSDGDGLTNLEEYQNNTDPKNADSDGDYMPDGWEIANDLLPLANDTFSDADLDGYSNFREYLSGTDPNDIEDIPPMIADGTESTEVDGESLSEMMAEYTIPECAFEWACQFDLDNDGDVDDIDIRLFSEDFGRVEN